MIPFIDLEAQQQRIRPQIDAAIQRVLAHGCYIMGPEVEQLETELCKFTGSKHCITVSNGTDALVAALMAYGVGPGDAVITTPFTFFATVEAIMMVGATPVFADIDLATFNICPNEIETVIKRVRAENKLCLRGIIPVDLFGLTADYHSINTIAEENGLFVVQDAAQSFGGTCNGRCAPTHGHVGITSFFPAKPLGCYGDGGAIFTDDDELAEKIRSIRVHGKGVDKYDNVRLGQNARLDTIQAAILLEKLNIYESEVASRQKVAESYLSRLHAGNDSSWGIVLPTIPEGYRSVWAQFTIRANNRNELSATLSREGIPSLVYYRTPSHLLGACKHLGFAEGSFPNSEDASNQVLSLPFHPYLENSEIERISSCIMSTAIA